MSPKGTQEQSAQSRPCLLYGKVDRLPCRLTARARSDSIAYTGKANSSNVCKGTAGDVKVSAKLQIEEGMSVGLACGNLAMSQSALEMECDMNAAECKHCPRRSRIDSSSLPSADARVSPSFGRRGLRDLQVSQGCMTVA